MSGRARQRGFTLIEMVVSIALSGVLVAVVAPPLTESFRARSRIVARGELVVEGRTALEKIVRDLREMGVLEGSTTAPDLSRAEDSRIDFGVLGYRLSGTDLQRTSDGGSTWRLAARGVSGLTIAYADEDGNALGATPLSAADRAAVRRVTVLLQLTSNGESLALRTAVYLRRFAFGGPS